MRRSSSLQSILDRMKADFGIDDDFDEASNHNYNCRCDKCRKYWKAMGPDPDTEEYGPFTKEEVEGGVNGES